MPIEPLPSPVFIPSYVHIISFACVPTNWSEKSRLYDATLDARSSDPRSQSHDLRMHADLRHS